MAWNRSSAGTEIVDRGTGKRKSAIRGIVAGAIVVVGAGIAAWWIWPGGKCGEDAASAEEVARQIREVVPATAATNAVEKAESGRRTAKGTRIPDNVHPDAQGRLRYPNGQRWVDPNDLHIVKKPKPRRLFTHTSENQIAHILSRDPSKVVPALIGRRRPFGARFVEDFKASFDDTVVIDKDDTPEEAALRKEVLAAKADLKAALDRGEDIAKIMNDAQDEIDRLARYRQDLIGTFREYVRDEKYSDQDVADFAAAANKMLEAHGLKKLATPKLTFRQMALSRARERAATKDVGKTEGKGEVK